MAERERQPGIEDHPPSDVRLFSPMPYFVHYTGGVAWIINQFPGRMLAERLDDRNRVGCAERVLQDGWIAEQHVKLDQNQFAESHRAGVAGNDVKKLRASPCSAQSWLSE